MRLRPLRRQRKDHRRHGSDTGVRLVANQGVPPLPELHQVRQDVPKVNVLRELSHPSSTPALPSARARDLKLTERFAPVLLSPLERPQEGADSRQDPLWPRRQQRGGHLLSQRALSESFKDQNDRNNPHKLFYTRYTTIQYTTSIGSPAVVLFSPNRQPGRVFSWGR